MWSQCVWEISRWPRTGSWVAETAADILIDTIHDWGVDVVFGLPGDGINGIMEALRKRQDTVRFVQVRHEEAAALMACGYAKFTGRLGVCLATSGPGGIHLLNGLYDAKLDGQPVLAITGMPYHDLIGTHTQQDVELDKVFMDVAKYSVRVMGPTHVENVAHLACRTALLYRGVSHISFPVDLQEREIKGERSKRNIVHHMSELEPHSARLPNDTDLAQAADILNNGTRVVILAGRGALGAGPELEQAAEILGAPIVKPLLEKAQQGMEKWRTVMNEYAAAPDVPMKPQVIASEVNRHLRDDAIVACDSGTIATWWARYIQVKRGQMHSLSGTLASMGNGLPY